MGGAGAGALGAAAVGGAGAGAVGASVAGGGAGRDGSAEALPRSDRDPLAGGATSVRGPSPTNLPGRSHTAPPGGNDCGGVPASIEAVNACQIRAGYVPPNTSMPPTSVIGTAASGAPIHTAVASCGAKPTNHASALLSVVPVFPTTS